MKTMCVKSGKGRYMMSFCSVSVKNKSGGKMNFGAIDN